MLIFIFAMMKIGRYFKIIFAWFLLLQMVNLSVNPPRHITLVNGMLTLSEDLSVNKMESIYEMISETVFKVDVPETQDGDDDHLQKTLLVFNLPEISSIDLQQIDDLVDHHFVYRYPVLEHHLNRKSPPPRFMLL